MNCTRCGQELTGDVVVEQSELSNGTPLTLMTETPDRNWIICDSCNTLLCNNCCQYPESGYCDDCIGRYGLFDYLVSVGLIRPKVEGKR